MSSLHYQRAWITLAPKNFLKSCEFYSDLLGKPPDQTLMRSDQLIYAEFHLTGFNLGIYAPKSQPEASGYSPLSICFQVDDLETAIELITNLGYPPPGEIVIASHGREVYAFDPDDNRLILYQSKIRS
jgi:predicted enzyme related to lactoylglutathione lyase